jgi:cytochrome c-type biogenesis protein CcmH/NrfG
MPEDSEVAAIYAIALERTGRKPASADVRKSLATRTNDVLATAWLSILSQPVNPSRADLQKVIIACTAELSREPNDAPLQYICGQHLAQTGNSLAALIAMHNAAVCAPAWSLPLTTAAELELSRGEIDAAKVTANDAYRRASADGSKGLTEPVLLARVAFAALASGHVIDQDMLKRLVDAVQKAMPGEERTLEIQVSLLARAGQLDDARSVLNRAIASPRAISAVALQSLAAISDLYHLGLADPCFERAQHDFGNTPEMTFARACSLMNRGDKAGGLKLIQAAAQAATQSNASSWRIVLCTYLERSGDSAARASWIKLADERPGDLSIQRAALASRAVAADREATSRIIQQLRSVAGENSADWRLARASWLLDADKLTPDGLREADTLVAAVLKEDPSSVPGHFLQGRVFERQNDLANALRQFRVASDLDPASPEIAMAAVRLLQKASDSPEIRSRLQKVADGPRASVESVSLLGSVQMKDRLLSDAEISYRRALQLQPSLPDAQNSLAMVLLFQGSEQGNAEALRLATDAAAASPHEPRYFETLADAQKRAGNVDAALQSLQQAIQLSGDNLGRRVKRLEWLVEAQRNEEAANALAEITRAKLAQGGMDSDLRNRLSAVELQLSKIH